MHDNIVRYIISKISYRKHPNVISLKNGNMAANRTDKKLPDIHFELDGQEYIADVAFCKDKNR